ncbi:hypothetical protein A0O34_16215 [Chryseobacterium glaciei]|uniref:Uncharacterized protein n=1 Tax=Chryseobacterium glaciei TaxID=1685010 RepID=A0A172XYF1_9FLAO|nr:hypothetical protein [Chryseobacterium glaciei]ANF51961.1 hypothetical protein A0O34_16215 [Chryseobacterium glaciei]
MIKTKLLIISSIIIGSSLLYGQKIHSALQLRNSHLWRGLEVSSGLIYTGDIHLDGKNFYGGFWTGGNFDGSYKEFNNYVGYKNKHLTVELWDIYNFSPDATYNNKEFFNYNASETGRFWDLRSYYTISDKVPLTLSANTVVFGRDRNKENTENKYSSFVSAEYPVYKNVDENLEVRTRVGYGFALNHAGEESNFFAKKDGINEVSLIVSKTFMVAGYKLPVGIWGMWNPVGNNAYLQFSVQAFSF